MNPPLDRHELATVLEQFEKRGIRSGDAKPADVPLFDGDREKAPDFFAERQGAFSTEASPILDDAIIGERIQRAEASSRRKLLAIAAIVSVGLGAIGAGAALWSDALFRAAPSAVEAENAPAKAAPTAANDAGAPAVEASTPVASPKGGVGETEQAPNVAQPTAQTPQTTMEIGSSAESAGRFVAPTPVEKAATTPSAGAPFSAAPEPPTQEKPAPAPKPAAAPSPPKPKAAARSQHAPKPAALEAGERRQSARTVEPAKPAPQKIVVRPPSTQPAITPLEAPPPPPSAPEESSGPYKYIQRAQRAVTGLPDMVKSWVGMDGAPRP